MAAVSTYTLKSLTDEVYDFVADRTRARFDMRQLLGSINNAVRMVWPKWNTTVIDETTTYDADTFSYSMPATMDDATELWFQPLQSTRPWVQATEWTIKGTTIYFSKSYRRYDGQTLRIVGVRKPAVFQNIRGDTGVLTNSSTSFTDANATFSTDGVVAGDKVYVVASGGNDTAVGTYVVSSVASETAVVLTAAYTGTSASSCVYSIGDLTETTDVPYAYMLNMTAYFLFLLWGHKGVGKDVELASQWAQYHKQEAIRELEEEKKRHRPRG